MQDNTIIFCFLYFIVISYIIFLFELNIFENYTNEMISIFKNSFYIYNDTHCTNINFLNPNKSYYIGFKN